MLRSVANQISWFSIVSLIHCILAYIGIHVYSPMEERGSVAKHYTFRTAIKCSIFTINNIDNQNLYLFTDHCD